MQGLQRSITHDKRYLLQAQNGAAGSYRAWANQAQHSSSSVYQAEEGSIPQSERQQFWQAFTQSVGQAPEQDAGHAARAAQQAQHDARSHSSPGQAMQLQPQPSLPAVPEGRNLSAPSLHFHLCVAYKSIRWQLKYFTCDLCGSTSR